MCRYFSRPAASIVGLLLFITSCASQPRVAKIGATEELPKDLQAKFEIRDSDAPAVKPSPIPSPSPAPISKAKKRKTKAKAVAAVKAPVVYPNRQPKVNPIWIGEKQTLEVTYLGLPAGDFATEVLPMKKIGDREVYHFRGTVKSSSVMNLVYRIDDAVESFWDAQGLFSHRFHMVLDETKQTRDVLELYDTETKKAFYWNRLNRLDKPPVETKEYFDMVQFVQDSFTAIYYVRTLPLVTGQVYTFPVVSEGKGWDCVVTVVGREMMDTPLGKKQAIILRPQTSYNGVLKQEHGDSFIWVTDDDRRLVVRLDAKVKIGSVSARLRKVELGRPPVPNSSL